MPYSSCTDLSINNFVSRLHINEDTKFRKSYNSTWEFKRNGTVLRDDNFKSMQRKITKGRLAYNSATGMVIDE